MQAQPLQRLMMRMPEPVLRWLAGDGETRQGGRILDARFQYLAARARRAPPLWSLPPAAARKARAEALAAVSGRAEPGVRVETLAIDGPDGTLAARAYRPEAQDPRAPALVFAHPGGGVLGGLDASHAFCSILAAVGRCAVVAADYRLTAEHRLPARSEEHTSELQ